MTGLNRRDVIRVAAAGAALAGGAVASSRAGAAPPTPLQRARHSSLQQAVLRFDHAGLRRGLSPVVAATVALCRSWSREVLLQTADGCSGLLSVDAFAYALACAAQAAGRPLHVRHWGHDAAAELGLGRFDGALMALDPLDLGETDAGVGEGGVA